MASRDSFRAVFSDTLLVGMDGFYRTIREMLKNGVDFDRAYSLVVQSDTIMPLRPGSDFVFNLLAD